MLDQDIDLPIELLPGESDDYLHELTLGAIAEPDGHTEHFIPHDLDEIAPGPFLGAILSRLDVSRLKGEDVVTLLRAQQRQTSHHHSGPVLGHGRDRLLHLRR